MQYLRQQHRQACLQAPVPIATLPPLSLLTPTSIPEVGSLLVHATSGNTLPDDMINHARRAWHQISSV